jgi:cytoskeleton protein RodZ
MDSIGDTLRRERLRRGLKLEQVAAQTKIGSHLLRAIEENRFDRLPGGLFTRSFLRQYTHVLDLNEDDIIASLKQFEEPTIPVPEPPRRYKPAHLPHMPTIAWFVVVMFGCGAIYAMWENVRRSLVETDVTAQRRVEHGGRDVSNRKATRAAQTTPYPEGRKAEDVSPARDAGKLDIASGEAVMHVMFAASEPVWLAVKSDGIDAYSGTLQGQESKEFDASTKMTILVGNAGGLAVSVNGKPVALTGAHGKVRSLVLTPSGVRIVPRTPPTLMTTPQDQGESPS